MRFFASLPIVVLSLVGSTQAQFGFFEQMFGGQQQQQQPQNVPSDPSQYQQRYDGSYCEHFLCPDTLACVHFPHHCPCPWPANQDKFELGEGSRICVSRGGFAAGEAARKVELARKGLFCGHEASQAQDTNVPRDDKHIVFHTKGTELLGNGDSIEYAICWRKQKAYLLVLKCSCPAAVMMTPDRDAERAAAAAAASAAAAMTANRDDY